jgi:hypothetical protein
MRNAAWGLVVGLLLVLLLAGWESSEAQAQRPGAALDRGQSGELISLGFDLGDGRQQVTIIDPRTRVMAVYHVEKTTGSLALKSVRNVQWDLMMEEFNTSNPTPREIRPLIEQR